MTPFGRKTVAAALKNKRAGTSDKTYQWGTSQISTPPGVDWLDPRNGLVSEPFGLFYYYLHDDSEADGQFIYILEEKFDHNYAVSKTTSLFDLTEKTASNSI